MKPILCSWTGEAMVPAGPYWAREADQQWVVGERYAVEVMQERSAKAHRAFFAEVNNAWKTLREDMTRRFPTATALRKYALIRTGWCEKRAFALTTNKEALALAAVLPRIDDYVEIAVNGNVVVALIAKSQSVREMGRTDFNKSANDVRDFLASLIGATPEHLAEQAA